MGETIQAFLLRAEWLEARVKALEALCDHIWAAYGPVLLKKDWEQLGLASRGEPIEGEGT